VAAKAGAMAATMVTSSPTAMETTTVRTSMAGAVVGTSMPVTLSSDRIPAARPTPRSNPSPPETSPISPASVRTPVSTCLRVAPTARSNPTSRRRCATRTLKVFQMTKDPTSSETPANTSSTVVKMPIESRTAALPSSATWRPVSTSTFSGRTPAMRSRSSGTATPLAAFTSTSSTSPTLSSTRCAVGRSKPASVAPSRLSVSPNPMVPTRVNRSRPPWSTTSTGSPRR
jgi:hypothetical protein